MASMQQEFTIKRNGYSILSKLFSRSQITIKNGYSILLFPLELFSHYPDTDTSHWLSKDLEWIMVDFFRGKLMV